MGGDLEQEGYRFDGFHLLPKRRLLLRDGQKVAVSRRALSVLIVLVERHGRIVGRNEILDQAFPGVFVEDQNITVHVSALRSLLGPAAIATIPGRGYRFAGTLEGVVPVAASPEPTGIAPAPPTLATPTNLPVRPPLIGRATELIEIEELLASKKLVTLTGPGGIGKTSLAVALGQRLVERFPDGVWLVDLAPLSDSALVATSVATVLGVTLRDGHNPIDVIATAIARKHLLLILDNAEYLTTAAAELAQALLDRAAGLTVLATSQDVLGLPIERVYRLDPLAVPLAGEADAETIARFGAVELFAARARAAERRFRLDDATASGVAEICRALDGVPLALEMAAARVPLLGLEGVRARLGDRLRLLAGRERIGSARHRTLRAMLEWSYGLLDPAEQRVFRRLAVFRGNFSLDAAIAVGGYDAMEQWEVIDALGRLIDKSLVVAEEGDKPRYRLLETMRIFGTERLEENFEQKLSGECHVRYFTGHFDQAGVAWQVMRDEDWFSTYAVELDNVRAALDWTLDDLTYAAAAVSLAARAGRLWHLLGLIAEGRDYIDKIVNLLRWETPPLDAGMLLSLSAALWTNTDKDRAVRLRDRAISIYRLIDEPERLGLTLANAAVDYIGQKRLDEAKSALDEAWLLLDGSSYVKAGLGVKMYLGILAFQESKYSEAKNHYIDAQNLFDKEFSPINWCTILINLGNIAFEEDAVDVAIQYTIEAVDGFRQVSASHFLGVALGYISTYLSLTGAKMEGCRHASEALPLLAKQGGYWLREFLEHFALLGGLTGQYLAAAKLEGFVAAGWNISGQTRSRVGTSVHTRLVELMAANLSDDEASRLVAEGASWTEDQAVDFARMLLISVQSRLLSPSSENTVQTNE